MSEPAAPRSESPDRIGPYRILERLGRGGMGEVLRAEDTRLHRQVAIKHLRAELVGDRNAVARFMREARALAQLAHPAIVPIYDLLEESGGVWIVMELIDGPTLAELIRAGPLPIGRLLKIAGQVVDGLAEAHEKGILHRDLKAENILVAPKDRARLVDFGLAKTLLARRDIDREKGGGEDVESLTSAPGLILGTFRSMSPEQARGLELGPRSDLFSFGVLLYEMLTGVSPFRGETPTDTLARICAHPPAPVIAMRPETPPGLVSLLGDLLEKSPSQRPRSAAAVKKRIEEIAARIEISAPPGLELDGSEYGPPSGRTSAPPVPILGRARRRALLGILGAALATLLALAGFISLGERPSRQFSGSDSTRLVEEGFKRLEAHERQESVDSAIELFQRAIDREASSQTLRSQAHAGLARAYLLRFVNTGRDPQWLSRAEPAARRALEIAPDSADAVASLALVLTARGRFEEAEKDLRRGLEKSPHHVELLQALGWLHIRSGDLEGAELVLREVLERAPHRSSLWDHLGSALIGLGQLEEGEMAFRRSLALRPDSVLARRNISSALYLQGRLPEAASLLREALEIRPEATVYSNLGAILFAQGLYSDAAQAFEKALDMGVLSHSNLSWANLADALRFIPGREEAARETYRRAIQLTHAHLQEHPDDQAQRSRLALYLAKSGESQRAMEEISGLETQDPERSPILYRLAVSLEILGARERALEGLKKALEAGQPLAEVKADPELLELRTSAAYHRLVSEFESFETAGWAAQN